MNLNTVATEDTIHEVAAPTEGAPYPNMIWIPGGIYRMGSDRHYGEEAPVHRVTVDGFWMDRTPVSNAQFRAFVEATGYRTFCEVPPDPSQYPGALPEMLMAASAVFVPPPRRVSLNDAYQWWQFVGQADWRHPQGPASSIDGKDDHPVVHLAWNDVEAYAKWAGKQIATEAEWEFAARGGIDAAEFAWGSEFMPGGRHMANTWQGAFPYENLAEDGYVGTSPVEAFPPNGFDLLDMIGNVWEWTDSWYSPRHPDEKAKACCVPKNPRGAPLEESYDPGQPQVRIPRKVIKGGSHLCAPNYCLRYRPAARMAQAVDTSTSHLGMRCIVRMNKAA